MNRVRFLKKIALAASVVFAMALTFSCTDGGGDEENNGGGSSSSGSGNSGVGGQCEENNYIFSSDNLFETGKDKFITNSKERNEIAEIAQNLKSCEGNATIEGHTDNAGSAASNQKLSEDRAFAVLGYLTERGIGKQRLKSIGYGDTKPIADNKTEDGRAQNRRIEIIVKKD